MGLALAGTHRLHALLGGPSSAARTQPPRASHIPNYYSRCRLDPYFHLSREYPLSATALPQNVARGGHRTPPRCGISDQRDCSPHASYSSSGKLPENISRVKVTKLPLGTVSPGHNNAQPVRSDAFTIPLHDHTTAISVVRTTDVIRLLSNTESDPGVFGLQAGVCCHPRYGGARHAHGPNSKQHRPGRE